MTYKFQVDYHSRSMYAFDAKSKLYLKKHDNEIIEIIPEDELKLLLKLYALKLRSSKRFNKDK